MRSFGRSRKFEVGNVTDFDYSDYEILEGREVTDLQRGDRGRWATDLQTGTDGK
jgi:hypothetical protein